MVKKTIAQTHQEHAAELMAVPGVVGVGIGEHHGKPCIMVLVAEQTSAVQNRIPTELNGFAVVVEQSGEFTALSGE